MRSIQRLVLCFVFLLILLKPSLSPAQPHASVDYVFLIDVSGSMSGQLGHTNIFPSVKEAIVSFTKNLEFGQTMYFFPFDDRIREMREMHVQSDADKDSVIQYVQSLQANGSNTAIYNTLAQSMDRINAIRNKLATEHSVIFFVYTDGDDNVSHGWSLDSILDRFNLKRGEHDWLYYTELGLPQDSKKVSIFKEKEHTTYLSEQKGKVHAIIHVETLLPTLNFGNLKNNDHPTRIEQFAVRGGAQLPSGYRISAQIEFDQLKNQSVGASISPKSFEPLDSVVLSFALVNQQGLQDGRYSGLLKLSSGDPLVVLTPSEVAVTFAFEAQPQVEISAGAEHGFPIAFGSLDPLTGSKKVVKKNIRFDFNTIARSSGDKIRIRVIQGSSNPQFLIVGQDIVLNELKDGELTVGSETREVNIALVCSSEMKAGDYEGQIVFDGNGIMIIGDGITDNVKYPGAKVVAWTFHKLSLPWSWWLWLLIALAVIVFLIFMLYIAFCIKEGVGVLDGGQVLKSRFLPVLLGEIEVVNQSPGSDVFKLDGRKVVMIGTLAGAYLTDVDSCFTLEPSLRSGRYAIKITAGPDSYVSLNGTQIYSDYLYDGQVIDFGIKKKVKVSYNNIQLQNPD